jgi:hypothetical protein
MPTQAKVHGIFIEKGRTFVFPQIQIDIEENGKFKYSNQAQGFEGEIKELKSQFVVIKQNKKLVCEGEFGESKSIIKGKWRYDSNEGGSFELTFDGYTAKRTPKHESIPMGKCKGFYMRKGAKHDMDLELALTEDGAFIGKGKDDDGEFEMTGAFSRYDGCEVNITKQYSSKMEVYNGVYCERLITGIWLTETDIGEEFEIIMTPP